MKTFKGMIPLFILIFFFLNPIYGQSMEKTDPVPTTVKMENGIPCFYIKKKYLIEKIGCFDPPKIKNAPSALQIIALLTTIYNYDSFYVSGLRDTSLYHYLKERNPNLSFIYSEPLSEVRQTVLGKLNSQSIGLTVLSTTGVIGLSGNSAKYDVIAFDLYCSSHNQLSPNQHGSFFSSLPIRLNDNGLFILHRDFSHSGQVKKYVKVLESSFEKILRIQVPNTRNHVIISSNNQQLNCNSFWQHYLNQKQSKDVNVKLYLQDMELTKVFCEQY